METEVLKVEPPDGEDDASFASLCARVAACLDAGEAVALPTETVYGLAAALDPTAPPGRHPTLERLKGRPADKPIPVAVADLAGAQQLVRVDHPGARKLARRFWPGPLTLVLPRLDGEGTLGIRVPAHAVTGPLLQRLGRPLALTSANRSDQPPACSAPEVVASFDGEIPMVVDAGPVALGEASAVVSFDGPRPVIHREGLIDRAMILRVAATRVLFVCTGNTCRSPMAAAGFRAAWARRRGVEVDELLASGGLVESAGVAAIPGIRASTEAIQVLDDEGIDLRSHRSSPLDLQALLDADHVFVLGRGHREAILAASPPELQDEVRRKVRLLAGDDDVADPIGGDRRRYQQCWDQIRAAVDQRLDEVESAVQQELGES